MKFKVIEGNTGFIETKLNQLKKEFNINILGISSSPRDPQLGVGGIAIIFTVNEIKEINVDAIEINKIDPEKMMKEFLDGSKGEKIIKDVISKNIPEKPCACDKAANKTINPVKKTIKRNTKKKGN